MAKPKQPAPIEQTPEFKQAVNEAVLRAADTIKNQVLEQISKARPAESQAASGDHAFAEAVAMAIAGLTDQGTGKRHVAPAILKQRADARELMQTLIVEARVNGERPLYQLRNKVYLDNVLVEPIWIDPATKGQRATEIEYSLVPNEAMVPVNEAAKRIFKAFKDSIGSIDKPPEERALMGVTPGGMVIKSGSKAVNPIAALTDKPHQESEGGLSIRHRGKPGSYKEVNVLGSIAEPARQTV